MKYSFVHLPCLLILCLLMGLPQHAFGARTFASLVISPVSTNIVAGAMITGDAFLATKTNSSGSTASGPALVYVDHISPAAPTITTSIDPSTFDIAVNATNDSTLTVTTSLNTPANTYTIYIVGTTNTGNGETGTFTPITNTLTLVVSSAVSNAFSISMSPASTDVIAGIATNVSATLTYLDYSATISGTVTNSVTVSPPGQGVTAGLNSIYAPLANNFGTTNLTLTISATANAAPGNYLVVVTGTNGSFTADSPVPGSASATNAFTVTDLNSFSMSMSPATTTVFSGGASSVSAAVQYSDNSPVFSGVLTNGVTVLPSGQGVTASLNSPLVSVNAGGQGNLTLTVTTTASARIGTYQIIVAATNSGFTANTPLPGIGFATNTFTVVSPPFFQSLAVSAGALGLKGTNGTPFGIYVMLASTNLSSPLSQWTPIATNSFDGNGYLNTSIALSNSVNPNAAQQYFTLLQTTNLVPSVATPWFSPLAAPYFAATPVTITSTTPGAIIRYTTDGTTPTETYGTIYTNPVTMQQPVNTNTSGFLSDCSGVTMLKAIAYKSGLPDSAIFTGNYEIIVPAPTTSSSPLCGLADIAYHVTDLAAMRSFYENYLGFAEPFLLPNSNTVAVVKINDLQYIELFQGALDPNQYQLISYGYQVTNAELFREQLSANGLTVSPGVTTNFLGNLSFFSTDPDGHTNEWIQYLTNSLTGLTRGQAMPGTQVYGYMFAFGGFTTNMDNVYNYLVNQCEFDSGKHTDIHIPNNNGFFETLAVLNPQDEQNAGKTDKIDLLNFRGITSAQSIAILTNRNPSIYINVYTNGSASSLENLAGDVYNPDYSRMELDDCWVQ